MQELQDTWTKLLLFYILYLCDMHNNCRINMQKNRNSTFYANNVHWSRCKQIPYIVAIYVVGFNLEQFTFNKVE